VSDIYETMVWFVTNCTEILAV